MKLLHTSDWHLGRALYGRKRYEEFEKFLDWLSDTIHREQVDALLIAGDVFDTGTPSNRAQELYYRFLCRAAASPCRHVAVIAGNHDSPSFLDAPKELLRSLNVHVVGAASENPEDEVLVLRDKNNAPEMIVCAVPYLRDRDVRSVEAGESTEDKDRKLTEGIRRHYAEVAALAEEKRAAFNADIPIVAMGHLFAAGGKTVDGDGVRELYVGSLARVTADIFSKSLDYTALGHLHIPQKVGGVETIRYSGSPLAVGFGEAAQQKSICLVELSGRPAEVRLVEVPVFRALERIKGDLKEISVRLCELAAEGSDARLEIVYEGDEVVGDLRGRLEAEVSDTKLDILRVKNNRAVDRAVARMHVEETLDDLTVDDVFERCLAAREVPDEQRPELIRTYREAVRLLYEEDARSE